jgi:hypothetical protein
MAAASPKVSSAVATSLLPKAIAAERRGVGMQRRNRAADLARADLEITDFGISVRHLDRLLGGLLLATVAVPTTGRGTPASQGGDTRAAGAGPAIFATGSS